MNCFTEQWSENKASNTYCVDTRFNFKQRHRYNNWIISWLSSVPKGKFLLRPLRLERSLVNHFQFIFSPKNIAFWQHKIHHKLVNILRIKYCWLTNIYYYHLFQFRPPLWSNGQSSLLQIRRPGFDSRHYQKKK
jgi:hypothetical protein